MSHPATNSIIPPNGTVSYASSDPARRVISSEEADNLDKTLNILAGRAEELRERLRTVLLPQSPNTDGGSEQKCSVPTASMLSDRLRGMRSIAEQAINTVDDILGRLDV